MKVLLTKNVPGIGNAGDIKEVSDGYVSNYLLPKGLAQILTKHTIAMLEAQKRKRERLQKLMAREHGKLAAKLEGNKFTLAAKADEAGTLYAGIDSDDIAVALKAEGYDVSPKEIQLPQAIKKTGTHLIKIGIGGKVVGVKVEVSSK